LVLIDTRRKTTIHPMAAEKYHILLIEDHSTKSSQITKMLGEASDVVFAVEHVQDLGQALGRVGKGGLDAVLLDHYLLPGQGENTYLKLRTQAADLPIFIFTDLKEGHSIVIDLFQGGIQDQFDGSSLSRYISRTVKQVRVKELFKESEARFRRLIETMTDTVIITDINGLVQYINPAGEQLFEKKRDDFIGIPFGFPVSPEGSTEIELHSKKKVPVIGEMMVVETEWQGTSAWLASIRNITERKVLEKSLQEKRRELEETNKQLRAANLKIIESQQKQIEDERLKVLLQMAGTTAHEMNQPLTVLLGNIELIEIVQDDPDELKECLREIESAGKKIAETVRNVENVQHYKEKSYVEGISIIDLDQTINILSVEDSDEDYARIVSALCENSNIHLTRAHDLATAMKYAVEKEYDLVLLDYMLPDGNCLELTDNLRKNNIDIPVIVVTGQGDEVLASKLIMEGAYDYVPKSMISKRVLNRSISNTLEKARLKYEIDRMHAKIKEMAIEDALTGLYNRRHFQNMLLREMSREKRYKQKMVLCMLDLDHFKQVNDTYGHQAGDMVLQIVGNILRQSFRESDIVCRYGGEEFAVLMPLVGIADAHVVCERIRQQLADYTFRFATAEFRVSVSIGLTQYNGEDKQTLEDFILTADKALYLAKKQGRNCVVSAPVEE